MPISNLDFPHPLYAEHVLKPSFAEARMHLVDLMMAANKAHVVMLTEQGILSAEDGTALLRALKQVEAEAASLTAEARQYEPGTEDLFTAHEIVSQLVQLALAQGLEPRDVTFSLLDEAAKAVIGRPLDLPKATVRQALDPVHFVEIRTQPGGPAFRTMRAWLNEVYCALKANRDWLASEQASQKDAAHALTQRVEVLTGA